MDNPKQAAKAWPYMVYKPMPTAGRPDRYPAFHFKVDGYGFNKLADLADSLATALGWSVELHKVTGWNSTPERGTPKLKLSTHKEALAKLTAR